MKTMKFQIILLLSIALSSCVSITNQQRNAGNYPFKTECLGIEMDGSQTVKAWGNGRNRWDAIEQAKKNAVNDMLFKGILDGSSECNSKPLVPEVNAREKYEDFFNAFFADKGGEYKSFISMQDERLDVTADGKKFDNKSGVTYSCIVRIKRSELKQYLLKNGILK